MAPDPAFYVVIAGAGSGTGASVAREFAKRYSKVVLLARTKDKLDTLITELKSSSSVSEFIGIVADVVDQASVQSAFTTMKEQVGDTLLLAAAVYNVGFGYVKKPFLEMTLKEYTGGFESNAVGYFNFAQATLPLLLAAKDTSPHPPSLFATGATAALRGVLHNAPFASGKSSLRVTSQSLAKEFGPQGVHIAHVIIDGGIDTPWGKDRKSNEGHPEGKISPESIARAYWWLHTQPRTSFTWEIDIRPAVEKW